MKAKELAEILLKYPDYDINYIDIGSTDIEVSIDHNIKEIYMCYGWSDGIKTIEYGEKIEKSEGNATNGKS